MAEESEEPSDGMTQPSREKPQWVRLLWLLPGFLLLLVGSLPWLSTVLPQWGKKLSLIAMSARTSAISLVVGLWGLLL